MSARVSTSTSWPRPSTCAYCCSQASREARVPTVRDAQVRAQPKGPSCSEPGPPQLRQATTVTQPPEQKMTAAPPAPLAPAAAFVARVTTAKRQLLQRPQVPPDLRSLPARLLRSRL